MPAGRSRRKAKRGFFWWARRVLLGLVVAIVVLAAAGAVYQANATAVDNRNHPPPGQLIDVGGYRMHIYCTGEGAPTVQRFRVRMSSWGTHLVAFMFGCSLTSTATRWPAWC